MVQKFQSPVRVYKYPFELVMEVISIRLIYEFVGNPNSKRIIINKHCMNYAGKSINCIKDIKEYIYNANWRNDIRNKIPNQFSTRIV